LFGPRPELRKKGRAAEAKKSGVDVLFKKGLCRFLLQPTNQVLKQRASKHSSD
jgi:hypothetical protein